VSKDSYYFSHDSNACMDPKILKLRMAHGWGGYGIFWAIIESLRNEENYMMSEEDIESLTLSLAIDIVLLKQILSKCLDVGLLVENEGNIYSESLLKRMEKADKIRKERVKSGREGGKASANAKRLLKESSRKTQALKERKVKETKEKKEKEVPRKRAFAPPSFDLLKIFVETEKLNCDPQEFLNHFAANGWKVGKGGLAMKDWKAAARGWSQRQNRWEKQNPNGDHPGANRGLQPGQIVKSPGTTLNNDNELFKMKVE